MYEGEIVGEYYADILVDNRVIVEIKASKRLVKENGSSWISGKSPGVPLVGRR